jgi:hypothetical protein
MAFSRLLVLVGLLVGIVGLAGCPGESTHSVAATHATASPVASRDKTYDSLSRHGRPSAKSAPRESFLSSYSNPEEGISLRYPRYYALEEGDLEEHSFFLKRQEDLDLEEPGTRLVATLLIPEDGYPNTTFEHGSLQLLVNDSATPESCKEPSGSTEQAATVPKNLTIQGVLFRGTELQYQTGGTQILERNYAGFLGERCYQFRLVIAAEAATEVATDPSGITRPADEARIMQQLEKIVGSTQFHEKRRTPPEELNADNALRL